MVRAMLPSPLCVMQVPAVSSATRDRVYRALLAELGLCGEHRRNLGSRGLTDPQIETLGYATLPDGGRWGTVQRLRTAGFETLGVPGFYRDSSEVRLAGSAGILIPVKNVEGLIVGLQVRCDHTEGGKYKWVSSAGKPYGCSSGAPVHVILPAGADPHEVWITEGPLKADIAAVKLNRSFLAASGVGNWRGVLPVLKELKPERVIIGFDMDKGCNAAVRLHLEALTAFIVRMGIRVFEADWDNHFKGLDDVLKEVR